ncbi:MAG: class I SAM-dependent methyltransferase [Candidatus Omnitrophica bacterium]|nr:class I SAM-dependent methyltransferase [Candidatus Omnitrophota bacterium]
MQDKAKEVACFSAYASGGEYNVFTEKSNRRMIRRCIDLSRLTPGARVADLGCGSGVFTRLLREEGLTALGLDLNQSLVTVGRQHNPHVAFMVGDVESLPLRTESMDGLLLSGIIHHLPDPRLFARECFRVLKPGGVFVAFDPNRRNPFMWLYRDPTSPFYSQNGVTPNERPIIARQIAGVFAAAGFDVSTDYCMAQYRSIASSSLRWALPVYNALDALLFSSHLVRPYRAFVLTRGIKPCRPFSP